MRAAQHESSPHGVVVELLSRQLLAPAEVADGGIVLKGFQRRNPSFLVERQAGPALFVKRARSAQECAAEAERCRRLAASGLDGIVPAVRVSDPDVRLLVLGGRANALDMKALHLREGRFRPQVAAAVGAAIARVHRAGSIAGDLGLWPAEPPWVLSIHRPTPRAFRELAPGTLELTKVIQSDPLIGRELDVLRREWHPTAIVHGDLKWENVLIDPDGDGPGDAACIVDWEHACAGDPLWDLGSLIAGYLSMWLFSIDAPRGVAPSGLSGRAVHPLDSMVPAIVALVGSYGATSSRDQSVAFRAVALRAAGARLLATAHEATQAGGSVNAHLVLHVQVASNLLANPEMFAEQILGA